MQRWICTRWLFHCLCQQKRCGKAAGRRWLVLPRLCSLLPSPPRPAQWGSSLGLAMVPIWPCLYGHVQPIELISQQNLPAQAELALPQLPTAWSQIRASQSVPWHGRWLSKGRLKWCLQGLKSSVACVRLSVLIAHRDNAKQQLSVRRVPRLPHPMPLPGWDSRWSDPLPLLNQQAVSK